MKLSLDKLEWPKLSRETFIQKVKVRKNIILFTIQIAFWQKINKE